jgi:hypothetical protein
MDKKVQVQPTAVTADVPEADVERAAQSASKSARRAPVITRIDIKRTMFFVGSRNDNFFPTNET